MDMNKWVVPIIIVICLILGGILFMTQGKGKKPPELPAAESGGFMPLSLTPAPGQQGQQQQQTQGQQMNLPGQQQSQQPQQELKASYSATIKTTRGNIRVNLRADAAPYTVINFINKAQSNFYNNLTFHRVEDWVVQGGDPKGDGTGGGNMQVEFNILPFVAGTLGVASRGDGKVQNDSQFFITKTDATWLDKQYTNFGSVTEGMDVVNKMQIGDKILGITVDGI
jgi:peptidyl-prolyl cis-trans isomerase B (cyclophilin B)